MFTGFPEESSWTLPEWGENVASSLFMFWAFSRVWGLFLPPIELEYGAKARSEVGEPATFLSRWRETGSREAPKSKYFKMIGDINKGFTPHSYFLTLQNSGLAIHYSPVFPDTFIQGWRIYPNPPHTHTHTHTPPGHLSSEQSEILHASYKDQSLITSKWL